MQIQDHRSKDEHKQRRKTFDFLDIISHEPPRKNAISHNKNMRGPQADFQTGEETHPVGTRSRRNRIPLHQTPYGKFVLEPIHLYKVILNLGVF